MLDSQTSDTAKKKSKSPKQEHPQTEEEPIPLISSLEEDLLTTLAGRHLYGLQICEAIKSASDGRQILKIGSLYPSLHRLEKKGLISSWMEEVRDKSRKGNRRKYYQVTSKGLDALAQKRMIRKRLTEWRPTMQPT